jgi:hypothetical protein
MPFHASVSFWRVHLLVRRSSPELNHGANISHPHVEYLPRYKIAPLLQYSSSFQKHANASKIDIASTNMNLDNVVAIRAVRTAHGMHMPEQTHPMSEQEYSKQL